MAGADQGELLETRAAYGEALLELGEELPQLVVLDADLVRSTRTAQFAERFPQRFFQLGIAEQDMVSTAAGMAASGLVPFCNSFAVFLTGRCYDQIRLQVAYPRLNVKLAGSSAGPTQGPDGASHQSMEDVALMRSLPNMTVVVPADATETRAATRAIAEIDGPAYLRLGRYPTPVLFGEGYRFALGQPVVMREGGDLALLANGIMVYRALCAAEELAREGLSCRVVNVHTVKPMPAEAIVDACRGVRAVLTVEEHSVIGGLGSAVAEVLAEHHPLPLKRLGVPDRFGESGLADELLAAHGLTAQAIAHAALKFARKLG